MAIATFSPFRLTAGEAGGMPDIQEALQKGFKSAYMPSQMSQDLLKSQIANRLESAKVPYADRMAKIGLQLRENELSMSPLKKQLIQAQINRAQKPESLKGNLANLYRLRESFPLDSSERKQVDQAISNAVAGSQGTQFSVDPVTHAVTFSQGGRGGNQITSQLSTDEQGNPIIVQKGTTPLNTSQQKAGVANVGREYIGENLKMPFMGSGSNASLIKSVYDYRTTKDPKLKKELGDKLVQAAVIARIVPEYAGLQLTAQRVPATVSSIAHQTESIKQGWPETLPWVVNNLPKELQNRVPGEHNKAIKQIKEEEEKYQAQGFPIRFGNKKQPVLKKRLFNSSNEFKEYLSTLSPEEREQAKKIYLGAK